MLYLPTLTRIAIIQGEKKNEFARGQTPPEGEFTQPLKYPTLTYYVLLTVDSFFLSWVCTNWYQRFTIGQ